MKSKTTWARLPSVTTGGKPYFWTAVIGSTRYWVSWSRIYGYWTVEDDFGSVWGRFSTPQAARKAVENL